MKRVVILAVLTCILSAQAANTRKPSATVGDMTMTVERVEKAVGWESTSWVHEDRVMAADKVCAVYLGLSAKTNKFPEISFSVNAKGDKGKPWSAYLNTIDKGKPWTGRTLRTSGSRLIVWCTLYDPQATSLDLTVEAFVHKTARFSFPNVKLSTTGVTKTQDGVKVSLERIERNAKDPHYIVHLLPTQEGAYIQFGKIRDNKGKTYNTARWGDKQDEGHFELTGLSRNATSLSFDCVAGWRGKSLGKFEFKKLPMP